MLTPVADLLRLVAVPLFGWAAYRDVRTRRVPNWIWYVLGGLGIALLAADLLRWYPFADLRSRFHLTQAAVSVFFVAPLGYGFWRIGGFGGADAKALMALALLFPTYPTYVLPTELVQAGLPGLLPVVRTAIGVFSLTILTNTVVVGLAFPLVLALRNAAVGRVEPAMFLGRVVPVTALPALHGRLFEDRDGFTRSGLDLDALRMYLRWRGLTLAELRASPCRHRQPGSVDETHPPTDGAVAADPGTDGGDAPAPGDAAAEAAARDAAGAEADRDDADREPDESGQFEWSSPATSSGDVDAGVADADASENVDGDGPEHVDGDATGTAGDAVAGTGAAEGGATGDGDLADPWAAERFLADVDGSAYGTTPEMLREGLETVVERDRVWISPGLPFIVPMFVGLLLALTYGDLLFGLLSALGLV